MNYVVLQNHDDRICTKSTVPIVESFYYVKHGSSIITSNVRQINLSNENRNTGVSRFRKIVSQNLFWHFNLHLKTFILNIFQVTEIKQ